MVMEWEIDDTLGVSENGSISMGFIEDEDEEDVGHFTEVSKFNPVFTSGASATVLPYHHGDGAGARGDNGVTGTGAAGDPETGAESGAESEVESVAISLEVEVRKPGEKEPSWRIALQVFPPFIVAGFGMVGAGLLLAVVQHWDAFTEFSELFILVPALLGLKGNLEMTLASRLSTAANLGQLDTRREQIKMVLGNLALTQAQANIVGFLASVFAMCLSWIPRRHFDINTAFMLSACSVATAALASLVLSLVMVFVVLVSRRCRINPDNVATPIAASLGDLTCLALLAAISLGLHKAAGAGILWLSPSVLFSVLALTPVWWVIAHRNIYTRRVLYTGWLPIVAAMAISSLGGLILDHAMGNFTGMAAFQPVINGVGGNLVAVQASRLSTSLHCSTSLGLLPSPSTKRLCPNPLSTFCSKDVSARTARVLLLLVLPGHLIFMFTVHYLQLHTSPPPPISPVFIFLYLTAALIQVVCLLYLADWLVHLLWRRGHDPDNFSIPLLTALGDLLGVALLAGVFFTIHALQLVTATPAGL